ncbi:PAS domain-containing protein [Spirosoma taeanense]|uniref:histidine kinase n=1 Tax=Spirosoma taeanense TaxID=2735870 RepID=A0A6M5Y784_9BACT|nr:PAS domain-containing protein [Spirosoma taeanense]QJW89344.1 PAS domain-containing protein [Spirosoma taeanense]
MLVNLPGQPPDLLLESVLQTSLNGIVLCRAVRDAIGQIIDFQVVRCNDRAAAMTGLSTAQMLNASMLTVDPDGLMSGIFEKYQQVVETGLPMHIEHYYKGGDVWMAQSLASFNDGVLAAWADVTALKRAEQAQLRETDLLHTILDNTQTGIAVMRSVRDRSGKVVDFTFTHLNHDAGRMTQRDRTQLIGQLYSVAWPNARTNGVLDWHIQVAETGEPLKMNGVHLHVDGYDGWYNIRIRPFNDGVIATFVDVTPLKRAELANQQQADLLRSVLDNSSSIIIAFQAIRDEATNQILDFRYIAQNEASRQSVNRTDEQVIGHTMLEYFPHVIPTGLFDRYVHVIETGEPARFEQEYNYDQLNSWYEISVMKWHDGFVLTLVDITASKSHQQQLEQANRDLQNANENLRQFAYVASHDLQEPLRKIVAFGDMLQDQFAAELGGLGQDIINRMQSATGRMSALIRDVLAYSRITTQRESFQSIPLEKLLAEIRHDLNPEFCEVNGVLETESLPTIRGDRAQLSQLFTNLLVNSLKFRIHNQPVVIRVTSRLVTGLEGPIGLNPMAKYHEISVQDNGIGFDSKYADRLFRVFQRLHTRQEYSGTGVGLAICRRVAENHRGAIAASGQAGRGATFRVYLPE